MTESQNAEPAKKAPVKKAAPKSDRVVTVTPDGREYRTSRAEAERLNRTAGYKIKN